MEISGLFRRVKFCCNYVIVWCYTTVCPRSLDPLHLLIGLRMTGLLIRIRPDNLVRSVFRKSSDTDPYSKKGSDPDLVWTSRFKIPLWILLFFKFSYIFTKFINTNQRLAFIDFWIAKKLNSIRSNPEPGQPPPGSATTTDERGHICLLLLLLY